MNPPRTRHHLPDLEGRGPAIDCPACQDQFFGPPAASFYSSCISEDDTTDCPYCHTRLVALIDDMDKSFGDYTAAVGYIGWRVAQ